MKKLLALIVTLLAFGTLIHAEDEAWKVTEFRSLPTDMDAKVNYPVKDPNGKQCALIKIETPYNGFTFDTGTLQIMKAEKKTGEWWVYVQKGVRKITIGHDRGVLREWYFPETINEGTVYLMKLKEGGSSEAAYTTAVAATTATSGFVVITSEPSGADVYIDDMWVGITPFNKRYPMNTRLNVRCTMSKHHEDLALVSVTSARTEQHFVLREAYGSIRLTSEPSGAKVFISGETTSRGVTPITITEVASGAVQVTLVKDLYSPIKQLIGVQDGRTTDYFVKLVPMFADITINSLRGATILIDGEEKGKTSFKGQLSEGLHEVEVVLASHKTVKRQIDVVAGLPQTISLNPLPIYGTLVVNSEPFDGEVYIGEKNYGKTPLIISDMLIGEYIVEVRKAGYATAAERVVVREGSEVEISPKLATGGEVLLSADTSGSTICVDGAIVGIYNGVPISIALKNGVHNVYAISPAGEKSEVQNVVINPGETVKKVRLYFVPGRIYSVNGVEFKMVSVQGGTFKMGATPEQGQTVKDNEKPAHNVTLSDYMIGQTEVTQELWEAIMYENPSEYRYKNNPVECVSWNDCQEFIQKLNAITGENFRLPTEAEWEYAARGGNKRRGYKYSGSNNIDDVAWYKENSSFKPHQVATKKPNELGLYDMNGNLLEFCQDYYGSYSSASQIDPRGPEYGSFVVYRGGSYFNPESENRISFRKDIGAAGMKHPNLGFRLAISQIVTGEDVVLSAEEENSKIYVDGECVGTYENNTPLKITLGGGTHYVYAQTMGWRTSHIQNITVSPGAATKSVKLWYPYSRPITINSDKGIYLDMIYVKGGTFQMGATEEQGEDAYSNEKPVHNVTLDNFMIGMTEVTQEVWDAVMGKNPSKYKKDPKFPVVNVSWNDCQTFIKKLNALTGENFRLPTEAEWEYAAKGGSKTKHYKYSGSNNIDDVAWYKENSYSSIHTVASYKQPNELGIYDMSGNAQEWCQDGYERYKDVSYTNPKGNSTSSLRVWRGGSYYNSAKFCRITDRNYDKPREKNLGLGFRLVLPRP